MSDNEQIQNAFRNKTVQTVEIIKAEFGRTYETYICFVFTDGSKFMLHGGIPYSPNPEIQDMKMALAYFSAQDIADKMLRDENDRRRRMQDQMNQKKYILEQLKHELGES